MAVGGRGLVQDSRIRNLAKGGIKKEPIKSSI
jgi:hypothetical protein